MSAAGKYPELIRMSTIQPETVYRQVTGKVALESRGGDSEKGTSLADAGRSLAIRARQPGPVAEGEVPVYALGSEGPLAVPSGTVLVRFAEGTEATTREDELARAGYAVAREVPYAPHAIIVHAKSGRTADALANLERLEKVQGVVNVEPQMISERAKR
jgi:hypothetical protein